MQIWISSDRFIDVSSTNILRARTQARANRSTPACGMACLWDRIRLSLQTWLLDGSEAEM